MKLKTRLTRLATLIASEADSNPEFAAQIEELLGDIKKVPLKSSVRKSKDKGASATGAVSSHRGRRTPAVLDPVALARESEASLRSGLAELDHDRLLDVVAEYGMDPGKLVMKWKGRCHGCHTDCEKDFEAPCWLMYDYDKEDQEAAYQASLISMYNLIGIDAIEVNDPLKSLMLLKPMKVANGGVQHGGGDKFTGPEDEAYQDFALWLEFYASCYLDIPLQKPLVSLIKPNKYEKKYILGEVTAFHGAAEDPQEGLLSGDALVWTSSLAEEPLATGEGPHEVFLPLGIQVITLTATDSDGFIGTRALKVKVKEPPLPE